MVIENPFGHISHIYFDRYVQPYGIGDFLIKISQFMLIDG